MALAFALAAICTLFTSKKWALLAAFCCWSLVLGLNIEHVIANNANFDISFMGLAMSKTFIAGSVITHKTLGTVFSLLCISFITATVLAYYFKTVQLNFHVLLSACIVIAIFMTPVSLSSENWAQMNVLESNARSFLDSHDFPIAQNAALGHAKPDLSGRPVIGFPDSDTNILLVIIEGLSFESANKNLMPYLSSLSDTSISYNGFIGSQRQTNKGIYAIFCGDYPNYLTKESKSDYMGVFGAQTDCLPKILSDNGYRTVYMQSADLGYMRKDNFFDQAGMDEIYGANSYLKYYEKSAWGVDDRSLYFHVAEKINKLSAAPEPWFLSLLTVSTHHPYLVPGVQNPTDKEALSYADSAFMEFYSHLTSSHLLDNTLVVITSDESAIFQNKEGVSGELASNHIPLILIPPEGNAHMSPGNVFAQTDLQTSMLDYVGMGHKARAGRSIFRSYDNERTLLFGNVYSRRLFIMTGNGELLKCGHKGNCMAFTYVDLFDGPYAEVPLDDTIKKNLWQMVRANELTTKLHPYVYIEKGKNYSGSRILLGDHKVELREGDRAIWNLRLKSNGYLHISVDIGGKVLDFKETSINKNESFDYNFQYTADRNVTVWTTIKTSTLDSVKYSVEELSIEKIRHN